MLAVKSYAQAYVDECESRMDAQLAAYRALIGAAGKNRTSGLRAAAAAFERLFFRNLTLALEASFVHRMRAQEGKDGNPLNEVRMLCASILEHDGVFTTEASVAYTAEASVLKLRPGEEIRISEAAFASLSQAFFAELRRRFT